MDKARYVVAAMMLVFVPPAIGLWYVIHPFVAFWRRLGAGVSYLILSVPAIGLGWTLWELRAPLLGRDLGFQPWLLAVAVPAAVAGASIARLRRRHLKQRILVGVPEMSKADKGRLLSDGIYSRMRNPRYAEFVVFVLAYVAFANYSGIWILWVLTLPALHLVVLFEERELRDRFGVEYEEYCRRVPRWIPRRD